MSSLELKPASDLIPTVRLVLGQVFAELEALLPGARVEHIGATAIPGALTKGDVDVVVCVPAAEFAPAARLLATRFAVKQRENWTAAFASFGDDARFDLPLGVQLVTTESKADFLVFLRDYFISNPAALAAYNELKVRHAPNGAEDYWRAKDRFLSAILAAHQR